MLKHLKIMSSALLIALTSAAAQATIIGGDVTGGTSGGSFVKVYAPLSNPFGAPNSVGNDTYQSPNLYGFDEDQNVTIGTTLNYNLSVGGSTLSPNPGTLAAGTLVASHYIFFDPRAGSSLVGYVDFDSDIIAVITSTNFLLASDILANTGINYLNPGARGLEANQDYITNITDRRVSLNFTASTPGDYIRVLTRYSPSAEVPESSPLVLLFLGLAGLLLRRRIAQ